MQEAISSYISEISAVLQEMSKQNMNVSIDRWYIGDFVVIKDSLNMIIKTFNAILSEFSDTATLVSGGAKQMLDVSGKLSQANTALSQEGAASAVELAGQAEVLRGTVAGFRFKGLGAL